MNPRTAELNVKCRLCPHANGAELNGRVAELNTKGRFAYLVSLLGFEFVIPLESKARPTG